MLPEVRAEVLLGSPHCRELLSRFRLEYTRYEENTRSVVFYKDEFGILSIPRWNSVGPISHEGILLGEAMRRVQMDQGLHGSDKDLQDLTAHILLDKPRVSEKLDQLPFFSTPKNPTISELRKLYCDLTKEIPIPSDFGSEWRKRLNLDAMNICQSSRPVPVAEAKRLDDDWMSFISACENRPLETLEVRQKLAPLLYVVGEFARSVEWDQLNREGSESIANLEFAMNDLTRGRAARANFKWALSQYAAYLENSGKFKGAELEDMMAVDQLAGRMKAAVSPFLVQ